MAGHGTTGPCVLGCSLRAQDRIEHYVHCPRVWDFARRFMGLHAGQHALQRFLLCERGLSDSTFVSIAVLVYAVFRTSNTLRNDQKSVWPPDAPYVFDMLEQHAKAGIEGHATSSALILGAVFTMVLI